MPFCPPGCLIELEPMLRRFDEIDVLEAVLEVKRSKVSVKKDDLHIEKSIQKLIFL